eukprot:scaffold292_cov212-Pinguiococcus_pyrenoidosus.AAC.2
MIGRSTSMSSQWRHMELKSGVKAGDRLEEAIRTVRVKGLGRGIAERNVHDVELRLATQLQPLVESVDLDAAVRPVRVRDGGLDDEELLIMPQGDGRVPGDGSHSPREHRVQPVQADDAEEVSAAHVRLGDIRELTCPDGWHRKAGVALQEVDVPVLRPFRDVLEHDAFEKQDRLDEVGNQGLHAGHELEDPHALGRHIVDIGSRGIVR